MIYRGACGGRLWNRFPMTSSSSVQALIRVCLVLGLRRQCQLLPAIMISVTTTRLSLRRPTATPHTRLLVCLLLLRRFKPLKTVKLVLMLAFLSIAFNGLVSPCAFYLFLLHKQCSFPFYVHCHYYTQPTRLIGPVMNNLSLNHFFSNHFFFRETRLGAIR